MDAPKAVAPLAEVPEVASVAAVRCITPDSVTPVSASAGGGCLKH